MCIFKYLKKYSRYTNLGAYLAQHFMRGIEKGGGKNINYKTVNTKKHDKDIKNKIYHDTHIYQNIP